VVTDENTSFSRLLSAGIVIQWLHDASFLFSLTSNLGSSSLGNKRKVRPPKNSGGESVNMGMFHPSEFPLTNAERALQGQF
jgi:hypothetical protein